LVLEGDSVTEGNSGGSEADNGEKSDNLEHDERFVFVELASLLLKR
jgi:hypothetical protein